MRGTFVVAAIALVVFGVWSLLVLSGTVFNNDTTKEVPDVLVKTALQDKTEELLHQNDKLLLSVQQLRDDFQNSTKKLESILHQAMLRKDEPEKKALRGIVPKPLVPFSEFLKTRFEYLMDVFRKEDATPGQEEQKKKEQEKLAEDYIKDLTPYVIAEPPEPIDEKCLPETLSANCKEFPNLFTGELRETPAKIVVAIQFGFDADVLEIALNEYFAGDVVDKVFLIESTRAHHGLYRKPLLWTLLSQQDRFAKFRDRVIYTVLDDALILSRRQKAKPQEVQWLLEGLQESYRWEKFREWNNATGFLSPDDMVMFGDTDEVPSRKNLNLFKHCQLQPNNPGVIDFGIWFPGPEPIKEEEGATSFRSDFPVSRAVPYTLGDPSIYTLKTAQHKVETEKKTPNRNRGQYGSKGSYILGGMHLTSPQYPPFLTMKRATCTECAFSQKVVKGDIEDLKRLGVHKFPVYNPLPRSRLRPVSQLSPNDKKAVNIPWFLRCNPQRYPYFYGKPDPRIQ